MDNTINSVFEDTLKEQVGLDSDDKRAFEAFRKEALGNMVRDKSVSCNKYLEREHSALRGIAVLREGRVAV